MAMFRNDSTPNNLSAANDASPLLGRPSTNSQSKIRRYLKKGAMLTVQSMVGGVTALQNAANAAAAPSDIDPSEMSAEWFKGLSVDAKALTIANASSAELVNAILNLLFLQVAYGILVNLWKRQATNMKERIIVSAELLFAIDSAITLAFIAEDSFSFLPYHLNAAPATISGLTNFASRLTGIDNAVMRARHFFNKDAKTQKALVKALRHYEDQENLNQKFQTAFGALNENKDEPITYQALLSKLLEHLMVSIEPGQFQKRTTASKVASGAGVAFDVIFAVYLGVCAFITFMQKGYQGKEDIFWPHHNDDASSLSSASLSTNGHDEAPVSRATQIALGAASGISSGALYFTRALDFRCMLYNMGDYLYENRNSSALNITFLLSAVSILIAANYFASSSGFNMAEKIVEAPQKAIIPMETGSVTADIYTYGTQAGVLAVNTDTCARKAFLNPPRHVDDTLNLHAFLRKLDDPTNILITEESRANAIKFIGHYEARQNQDDISKNPASFYPAPTSGLDRDPEAGSIDQARPSQNRPSVGIRSDDESPSLRMQGSRNSH
jgi:hypothetical protein